MEDKLEWTKGPWKWVEFPKETTMARLMGNDDAIVCHFGDSESYYPIEGTEPSEADKALIAASPDLLKAVKTALEFFYNPTSFHIPSVEQIYKNAIAKAEGKA